MLVEWFVVIAADLLKALLAHIPGVAVPDWLNAAGSEVSTLLARGAGFGHWFPFALAGQVALAVTLCASAGILLKIGRVVLSLFTAGGGSAG